MLGGFRERSGRSKSGYYKGIYCGSTYELCWIIYNIDHNIKFERFNGYLTDGKLKYYPDFLIDNNTIVEIKGYHTSSVDSKKELAESKGYKVNILYKKDLEHIFKYVKNKYNVPSKVKFYILYDSHKPTYNMICEFCNKNYETDLKPRKNKITFCSRICAGKFRFKENFYDYNSKRKITKTNHIKNFKLSDKQKLTENEIIEIYNSKDSYRILGIKYNVNKSMISHIKKKRVYKDLLNSL
jgi:hypothetical protein